MSRWSDGWGVKDPEIDSSYLTVSSALPRQTPSSGSKATVIICDTFRLNGPVSLTKGEKRLQSEKLTYWGHSCLWSHWELAYCTWNLAETTRTLKYVIIRPTHNERKTKMYRGSEKYQVDILIFGMLHTATLELQYSILLIHFLVKKHCLERYHNVLLTALQASVLIERVSPWSGWSGGAAVQGERGEWREENGSVLGSGELLVEEAANKGACS